MPPLSRVTSRVVSLLSLVWSSGKLADASGFQGHRTCCFHCLERSKPFFSGSLQPWYHFLWESHGRPCCVTPCFLFPAPFRLVTSFLKEICVFHETQQCASNLALSVQWSTLMLPFSLIHFPFLHTQTHSALGKQITCVSSISLSSCI